MGVCSIFFDIAGLLPFKKREVGALKNVFEDLKINGDIHLMVLLSAKNTIIPLILKKEDVNLHPIKNQRK